MKLSIHHKGTFKKACIGLLKRILDYLLNVNNPYITSNGEMRFIKEYISSMPSGKSVTFFDIGANVGEYSELLLDVSAHAHIKPFIHVFEPVRYTFERLQQKKFNADVVQLNQLGVSDKEQKMDIYYNTEGSTLASLYQRDIKEYHIELSNKEEINLIRLDQYISASGIKHIHLLKIDIEGHELSAFEGLGSYLTGSFIDLIQFEYGGANIDSRTYLKDFFVLFEKNGFKIFKIQRTYLEPVTYSASMENFKHSNYIAVSNSLL